MSGIIHRSLDNTVGILQAIERLDPGHSVGDLMDKASAAQSISHRIVEYLEGSGGQRHVILYHGAMLDASTQTLHVHSEFVSGGSLRRLLGRMAPLEVTVVRAYSEQILLGLEQLHVLGHAHGSLCNERILIGRRGELKLGHWWLSADKTSEEEREREAGDYRARPCSADVIPVLGPVDRGDQDEDEESQRRFRRDFLCLGCMVRGASAPRIEGPL